MYTVCPAPGIVQDRLCPWFPLPDRETDNSDSQVVNGIKPQGLDTPVGSRPDPWPRILAGTGSGEGLFNEATVLSPDGALACDGG